MTGALRCGASMALPVGACCGRRSGWPRWVSSLAARRPFLLASAAAPQAKPGWRGPPALPSPRPAAAAAAPARFCSGVPQGGGRQPKSHEFLLKVPNPLTWLRTRFYFFLIRAYFDQEFSIHEFTEGAKQAFTYVSRLISQCKYDLLEELVTKEVIQVLKEKLASLSENHKNALAAGMDEIMFTTAGDVGIYYDDSGRKFVSILMHFWYLSSADLPDELSEGPKIFFIGSGNEIPRKTKHLLSANYEFRREFTQGAKPDWTITRIEHPKLL